MQDQTPETESKAEEQILNNHSRKLEILSAKITRLERKTETHTERLKGISPSVVETFLKKSREDILQVRRGYQLITLKQAVVTEVTFCSPRLALRAVKLFDLPESFWEDKESISVARWVEIVANFDFSEYGVKGEQRANPHR